MQNQPIPLRPTTPKAKLGTLPEIGPINLTGSYELCALSLLVVSELGDSLKSEGVVYRSAEQLGQARDMAVRTVRRLVDAGLAKPETLEDPEFLETLECVYLAWWAPCAPPAA